MHRRLTYLYSVHFFVEKRKYIKKNDLIMMMMTIAMMIIFVSDNGINDNISLTIDSCGTDWCACFFDI